MTVFTATSPLDWIGFAALLAAVWIYVRGGTGTAMDTLAAANRALEKHIADLEQRLDDLEDLRVSDQATIAELRAKTDITLALRPLLELERTNEKHARERHDAMLVVLNLIAANCGPEPV